MLNVDFSCQLRLIFLVNTLAIFANHSLCISACHIFQLMWVHRSLWRDLRWYLEQTLHWTDSWYISILREVRLAHVRISLAIRIVKLVIFRAKQHWRTSRVLRTSTIEESLLQTTLNDNVLLVLFHLSADVDIYTSKKFNYLSLAEWKLKTSWKFFYCLFLKHFILLIKVFL